MATLLNVFMLNPHGAYHGKTELLIKEGGNGTAATLYGLGPVQRVCWEQRACKMQVQSAFLVVKGRLAHHC